MPRARLAQHARGRCPRASRRRPSCSTAGASPTSCRASRALRDVHRRRRSGDLAGPRRLPRAHERAGPHRVGGLRDRHARGRGRRSRRRHVGEQRRRTTAAWRRLDCPGSRVRSGPRTASNASAHSVRRGPSTGSCRYASASARLRMAKRSDIELRPSPANCGKMNHIQCDSFRPARNSASARSYTPDWAWTKRWRSWLSFGGLGMDWPRRSSSLVRQNDIRLERWRVSRALACAR